MKKKRTIPESRPEHKLEMQVAVLLDLYEWLGHPQSTIYIAVSKDESTKRIPIDDPDDELILALYGHDIDAKPNSKNEWANGFLVDPHTGEQAYLLGIQHIQWIGQTQARVEALYLKGTRWGSTFTIFLSYDGGQWLVTEKNMTGMFY